MESEGAGLWLSPQASVKAHTWVHTLPLLHHTAASPPCAYLVHTCVDVDIGLLWSFHVSLISVADRTSKVTKGERQKAKEKKSNKNLKIHEKSQKLAETLQDLRRELKCRNGSQGSCKGSGAELGLGCGVLLIKF